MHAVLASRGVSVSMSDLFGVGGAKLLDRDTLPAAFAARVASARRLIDVLDFEEALFAGIRSRLATDADTGRR